MNRSPRRGMSMMLAGAAMAQLAGYRVSPRSVLDVPPIAPEATPEPQRVVARAHIGREPSADVQREAIARAARKRELRAERLRRLAAAGGIGTVG